MNRIDLCGSWTMTGADGTRIASEVPGSVLKTLLDNGKIVDPFDGMNEYAVCDVLRQEWRFERSFEVTVEIDRDRKSVV